MDIFPIWKSTYFFLSGDNAVVRIIAEDGVVIYRARVSRIPDEDYMHVNLNKPCQAYIDSRIVPVDTEDAVYPMDAYEEFVLQQLNESTGVWADIYSFAFKNDWSYEDTDTLNEPINGHAAAGQVVSLSYLVTGNTESVCYDVVCPEPEPGPGPTPPTPPVPADMWIFITNAPQELYYSDLGSNISFTCSHVGYMDLLIYSGDTLIWSAERYITTTPSTDPTHFNVWSFSLGNNPVPNTGSTVEQYRGVLCYRDYPSVKQEFSFVRNYENADPSDIHLTIEALSAGTLYWLTEVAVPAGMNWNKCLWYSKGGDTDWRLIHPLETPSEECAIHLQAGEKVRFRGQHTVAYGGYEWDIYPPCGRCAFGADSNLKAKVYGNIDSLFDEDYVYTPNDSLKFAFRGLFASMNVDRDNWSYASTSWLVDASDLVLPFTALTQGMYEDMFFGCAALEGAPALPATVLAESCYHNMFRDCTSLTDAPELPAAYIADGEYRGMFRGCSSLGYVKCLATAKESRFATLSWMDGVPYTGVFATPDASIYSRDEDGIPAGWTITNV